MSVNDEALRRGIAEGSGSNIEDAKASFDCEQQTFRASGLHTKALSI